MPVEGMGHFDFIYTADFVGFQVQQHKFSSLSHRSAYHFQNYWFHLNLLESILNN